MGNPGNVLIISRNPLNISISVEVPILWMKLSVNTIVIGFKGSDCLTRGQRTKKNRHY